jgi:hypothetical protein
MDKVLRSKQIFRWCKQLFKVSLFGLYAAISLETNSSLAAPAARLEDWRFYPEAFQLEINLSAGTTPRYFYLAQPPRMVVDLPDTKLGYVPTLENYSGAIQRIRVSQLNASVTRIVLDLAPGTSLDPNQVQLQPISAQNTTRWVLRPLIAGGTSSQQGNYPPPSNLQPSNYNYPPPSNLPPSNYNYPPPSNLPPSNLPPSNYNYPPPSNLPPSNYNYPPPSNYHRAIYHQVITIIHRLATYRRAIYRQLTTTIHHLATYHRAIYRQLTIIIHHLATYHQVALTTHRYPW